MYWWEQLHRILKNNDSFFFFWDVNMLKSRNFKGSIAYSSIKIIGILLYLLLYIILKQQKPKEHRKDLLYMYYSQYIFSHLGLLFGTRLEKAGDMKKPESSVFGKDVNHIGISIGFNSLVCNLFRLGCHDSVFSKMKNWKQEKKIEHKGSNLGRQLKNLGIWKIRVAK